LSEKSKKTAKVVSYEIHTNDEDECKTYFAREIRIEGAFVKFIPLCYMDRFKQYAEMPANTPFILPEHVIDRIYVVTNKMLHEAFKKNEK